MYIPALGIYMVYTWYIHGIYHVKYFYWFQMFARGRYRFLFLQVMPPLWAEATNRACVRFNINFEFNLVHKFTFTERRQMNKGGMLNRIVIGSEFLPAVYLNFEQAIVRQCLQPN